MLELVKNTWVKGVLEQSLHGAAMIELGLEKRANAVERSWDTVLQTPDQPTRPLPRGIRIISVSNAMNRALLILGAPGSGKTTMLLELARNAVARAEKDLAQPIPVVFNLSSWSDPSYSIAEWLVGELSTKYNIPTRVARPWIENDDLLLLLDGLDEVRPELRESYVQAINDFRQEHGLTPLVVCSRIEEYEELTSRLRLQGAVLLQPLTSQQIDQYLEGAGTELLAVRRTLQHDTTLQELVQSPLILSIMVLAYRGMSVEDLRKLDSLEARRRHLFDAYVRGMFERRKAERPCSPEQTIHRLAWLAQELSAHRQTIFLIEELQPDWLPVRMRRQVRIVALLVHGLVSGLVFGLVDGLVLGLVIGLVSGLVLGLVSGLVGGLVFGSGRGGGVCGGRWAGW